MSYSDQWLRCRWMSLEELLAARGLLNLGKRDIITAVKLPVPLSTDTFWSHKVGLVLLILPPFIWAAWYITRLLAGLVLEGVVLSFLFSERVFSSFAAQPKKSNNPRSCSIMVSPVQPDRHIAHAVTARCSCIL